jgi:peptidyl-prolyl cis-trans isomerase C
MRSVVRPCVATVVVILACLPAVAQNPAPPPTAPTASAATANAVAATVNGQPILELAIQRGLKGVPPARHAEVRPERINQLIDTYLIEQHLIQLNITVEKKEVDGVFDEIRAELKKEGKTFEEMLKTLDLGEDELRFVITTDLRWNKYLKDQATDKALIDLFTNSREMFDGTMVRARHILLSPPSNDPQAAEQAKAYLLQLKKYIDDQVTAGLAKLPANTDNLGREQARIKLLDDTFAAVARERSSCASKARGGDVDWFPRIAGMVEPFAKAAFALKPYEMSDVVKTQYGYHLILATDRRPGKETKFEDVKEEVKEVFQIQLRDALAAKLRQTAKIVINPPPKP